MKQAERESYERHYYQQQQAEEQERRRHHEQQGQGVGGLVEQALEHGGGEGVAAVMAAGGGRAKGGETGEERGGEAAATTLDGLLGLRYVMATGLPLERRPMMAEFCWRVFGRGVSLTVTVYTHFCSLKTTATPPPRWSRGRPTTTPRYGIC